MKEKTKVCAYCRVSTKDKEQLGSLENQKQFFLREFGESDDCELVQLYADSGRSGTRLTRPDFDRMIRDAGIDKTQLSGDLYRIVAPPQFQRILVKNTSRFARNVSSDMLIKTLSANRVFIDFIDTGLSTERPGDLLTLQVFQAMDEHESRDKSRKVIFGMQEGVRNGVILSHSNLYGYRYYPKPVNRLEAIPEEAAVVRMIFHLYTVENHGAFRICKDLAKRGIYTRKGALFNENTILKMLRNETYMGLGVRNKFQGYRVFSAQTFLHENPPVIFETDRVDPIIDRTTFYRAQELMRARTPKSWLPPDRRAETGHRV